MHPRNESHSLMVWIAVPLVVLMPLFMILTAVFLASRDDQSIAQLPTAAPPHPTVVPLLDRTVTPARRTAVGGESATMEPAIASSPMPAIGPSPTATAAPTRRPLHATSQPAITVTASPEPLAFVRETFDLPPAGWPNEDHGTWSSAFIEGRYHLTLKGQPSAGVVRPLPSGSFQLSADVAVSRGSGGIIFLSDEPALFYGIVVSPDGAYAILSDRRAGGMATEIVEATPSTPLNWGAGATNRLRIERDGARVRCLINDHLLAEFTLPLNIAVDQYSFVLTSQSSEAHATFDNVVGERLPEF